MHYSESASFPVGKVTEMKPWKCVFDDYLLNRLTMYSRLFKTCSEFDIVSYFNVR